MIRILVDAMPVRSRRRHNQAAWRISMRAVTPPAALCHAGRRISADQGCGRDEAGQSLMAMLRGIPICRPASSEEIANLVVFLVSEPASDVLPRRQSGRSRRRNRAMELAIDLSAMEGARPACRMAYDFPSACSVANAVIPMTPPSCMESSAVLGTRTIVAFCFRPS